MRQLMGAQLFRVAQSLNYRAKVKTGSPECADLPGSLKAAQVSNAELTIYHGGHVGRGPLSTCLPCHSQSPRFPQRRLSESAVSNDFSGSGSPDLYQHVGLSLEGHYVCNQETASRYMVMGRQHRETASYTASCALETHSTLRYTWTVDDSLLVFTLFQESLCDSTL